MRPEVVHGDTRPPVNFLVMENVVPVTAETQTRKGGEAGGLSRTPGKVPQDGDIKKAVEDQSDLVLPLGSLPSHWCPHTCPGGLGAQA